MKINPYTTTKTKRQGRLNRRSRSLFGVGVNPNIFRAYDIRGIYPSTINEEAAYLIGRAFVKFLRKPKLNIVVGRDSRLSSPSLFKVLTKGILEEGANVIDIGLASSPMFYWVCSHSGFDGGMQISASHTPAQFNGFKIVREEAIPVSGESGLKEIKKIIEKYDFSKPSRKLGQIKKKNFLKDYIDFNLKLAHLGKIKPFKIVIDTANAVSGIDIKRLFQKLTSKFYHLFAKLDGNFPNHNPDPLIKENLSFLQKETRKRKANLGIALDGDGDRIIFVDEKGKIIRGDFITALISQELLKNHPREKIFYEVRSSQIVKEVVERAGGKPILGKAGHSLIKEKMRKENILFAGELSGHYFFKEIGFFEGPLLVILKILDILSRENKPLSELIHPFKIYFQSGEINFEVKDKEKAIKKVKNHFRNIKRILHLDGITVEGGDWWFNLRPSHTEDLLRLNIETKTKKLLSEKKKELISLIRKR